MAVRKPVNDPEALLAATDLLAQWVAEGTGRGDTGQELAENVVASFRTAEFETVTTKVAGEEVTMRRLVLTTDWAVQTN
jgi:hypothetical protein